MEFMPQFAPVVVLIFLGTCFGLGLTGLGVLYGLARRKRLVAKYSLALALAGAGIYAVVLLGASLASQEKVLAMGELKYFCEIDCHAAYSVVEVTRTKTLGAPAAQQRTAAGIYYVVRVRTWFDERTISSRRAKGMPLTPNPREVVILDAAGGRFTPSAEGQAALEEAQGKSTPFTQPLRPGESYVTDLVFDLPEDIRNPRLLLTDAIWMTCVLIGHERSPFHKKIYFALEPRAKAAWLAVP